MKKHTEQTNDEKGGIMEGRKEGKNKNKSLAYILLPLIITVNFRDPDSVTVLRSLVSKSDVLPDEFFVVS
jgi:hypothetical protein